ncbi:unnamed protein product [Ranitomeya imitator]|uniref:Uncharacterized protein n=1 Tax=Ranitomeya imitator TaxID=111125 RepID=A0ABN9LVV9_9NEOB|nr:unnamed protein product [Ranitomeya imitator]
MAGQDGTGVSSLEIVQTSKVTETGSERAHDLSTQREDLLAARQGEQRREEKQRSRPDSLEPAQSRSPNGDPTKDGNQGKHRVTKHGPALSYPMFTLVTGDLGIVGRWRAETTKSTDLQTAMQLSIKAIQHENVDVRVHALTSLKETLYKNQAKLLQYSTDSETVEPVISQLVTVLLIGCQDASPQARLLCGECLGQLGAIDPGRLDFSVSDTQGKGSTFVTGVEDVNFAYELLMELTRAFLAYADNVRAQDSAAYAIQELLAIYECREGRTDCPGRRLWRRFPEHVQEILEPHLNSRYKSSRKAVNWTSIKKPIYLSRLGNNFADWSACWAGYLITKD